MTIGKNISLREARQLALSLGATVTPVWRTGEWRFFHPLMTKVVTTNCRRKDASHLLVSWLRQLEARLQSRAQREAA
jgi:hypothetical protein